MERSPHDLGWVTATWKWWNLLLQM
jgi:hypothetical protein